MAKKGFDGDGIRDARRSDDWNDGYKAGWHDMRTELGDQTKELLRHVSDSYAQKRNDIGVILCKISRVYAYIYGSLDIFNYNYSRGRLLSEPEIRFHRVANQNEIHKSFDMLTDEWSD